MYKHLSRGVLALALLTAVACSDDDPTESSQAQLTQEEVEELAEALSQIGFPELFLEVNKLSRGASPQSARAGGLQPLADPETFNHTFAATANCPVSGKVELQAELDVARYPDEDRLVADLGGSQRHDKCRVPLRRGGTIEVTGAPNLSWEMHFEAVQGQLVGELTAEYKGGFTWAKSDGRSGQCTVDFSGKVNPEEGKATLEGKFCNISVTKEVTWEVEA
jgi:hypothetical protein